MPGEDEAFVDFLLMLYLLALLIAPLCPCSQTADNWATDPLQCAVPGFGYTPLYANNGGTNPISSFPVTYDKKLACNNTVYMSPIVDTTNNLYVYGQLYAWKVGSWK